MEHRQLQTERLVIVIDVLGPSASGKTAKIARIINAVKAEIGGLDAWDFRMTSTEQDALIDRMDNPQNFEKAALRVNWQAHHSGT